MIDGKSKRRKNFTLVEVEAWFRMEEEDESELEKKSRKPLYWIRDPLLILIGPRNDLNGTVVSDMNGRVVFLPKTHFPANGI